MTFDGPFELPFDFDLLDELDRTARAAARPANYGDRVHWELQWASAFLAVRSRCFATERHYQELHAWVPRLGCIEEAETHVATILFSMDSAIECLAYGLNAVGNGIAPAGFRDCTSPKALRSVSPAIVIGGEGKKPAPGFADVFPSLQAHWIAERAFLSQLTDCHDVSKHRCCVGLAGRLRSDAPPGFFESLGLVSTSPERAHFMPRAEVLLDHDPKTPWNPKKSSKLEDCICLETLCLQFRTFMETSATLGAADLRGHLPSLRVRAIRPQGRKGVRAA
jgi:hypothetical protein